MDSLTEKLIQGTSR